MIFKRHLISIIVILLFSVCSTAQDTNYVYRDTAIVADEREVTETVESNPDELIDEETEDDLFIADTTLRQNQLFIDPDSVKALKNLKAFGYAKNLDTLLIEYQNAQKEEEASLKQNPSWVAGFFASQLTMYFFWMVAIAFVVFILYRLFFTEGFFQRSYARSKVKITEEGEENTSETADYTRLIAQAISQQNYRLAIRYYYLQSLQKLASKGLIEFAPDKTNYEYVQELAGKVYKQEFASLTLHYEYAWYGEFEIDRPVFETIQNKFNKFNTVL